MSELVDKFLKIQDISDLSNVLSIPVGTLIYYSNYNSPQNAYKEKEIKKKNGGTRIIYAPNKQLKLIQKRIAEILNELYTPKFITHGYTKGRSIVSNATVHKNKTCVLNIDLKDFFDTIHIGRVIGLFKSNPFCFNADIANKLAYLVCYKRRLPQGAPTSPIISNFICRRLDNDLIKLTSKYKIVCTRYCDDITISTDFNSLPPGILTYQDNHYFIGAELESVIRGNDFFLNYDKLRCQLKRNRQTVTGLVVNKKVNIQKSKYRHLRAIMHSVEKNGLKETAKRNNFFNKDGEGDIEAFKRYLRGTIEYYKMVLSVSNAKYQKIARQYNKNVEEGIFEIVPIQSELIEEGVFIIETSKNNGTAFYVKGIGLVTCLHNVYNINIRPLDCDRLIKDLYKTVSIHYPRKKEKVFKFSYISASLNDDLLVLKLENEPKYGFKISTNETYEKNKKLLTTIGYPTENESHINTDCRISYKIVWTEIPLCVIDKTIYYGDSGGPVLDENNNVIGYIDRGNELGRDEEENYNAFCPITRLIELIERQKKIDAVFNRIGM